MFSAVAALRSEPDKSRPVRESPLPTPSLPAQDAGCFITHRVTYKGGRERSAGHGHLGGGGGLEAEERAWWVRRGWRQVGGVVGKASGEERSPPPPESVSPSPLF